MRAKPHFGDNIARHANGARLCQGDAMSTDRVFFRPTVAPPGGPAQPEAPP
jgi:hypothetical protein